MTKFYTKDKVRYVGANIGSSHDEKAAIIKGIKCISEETNKPIYFLTFCHEEEQYGYGIHEDNLTLIKRRNPDWEV